MAYENSGMLGLVSPGGRGYLAAEQQGLTPEQMAQNGAITFAEAIALKQKADRMRGSAQPMQAQQQQPQQPETVVDGLRAQVMQGAGQVQPSPDMSAMIAGNAARYARGGGITTLPANVGNYNMASGGIVAFDGGGGVEEPKQNYASVFDDLQRRKMQARARGDFAAVEQINTEISAALKAGAAQNRQKIFEAFTNPYIEGARNIREFGLPPKDAETVPGSAAPTPAPTTPPDTDPLRKLEYVGGAGTRNRATFPGVMDEPPPVPPVPPESENEAIYKQADELLESGRGISAPRLNAASLFPDVRVSQAEQDKIKGDLRAEGEASGLPGLLRRGAERTGKDIEDVKKNKRSDTWLLLAQAGFGIAGSADPFGTAVGKAGQQFASQYATLNKDIKTELRALNKDQESYQRSMAEFELNQNSESRKRVEDAQKRIDSRQDKVADITMKQADLDFQAAIANRSEDTKRRGMKLQALLARIKNPEKVTLQSAFAEAALRNDTVTMDRLVVAAGRMSDVSSTVVAARINAARQAAGQGGPGMGGGNFAGFEIVEGP